MRFALVALAAMSPLAATTLERLSMEQIIAQSTSIVRGRVTGCTGEMRRNVIYTRCDLEVIERWKGDPSAGSSVYLHGGSVQGMTQTFAGTPQLNPGEEYVLFLWAGKAGINQLIGLTQGVFQLAADGKGNTVAVRAASSEPMLDALGNPVADRAVRYRASELKALVARILGGAK